MVHDKMFIWKASVTFETGQASTASKAGHAFDAILAQVGSWIHNVKQVSQKNVFLFRIFPASRF